MKGPTKGRTRKQARKDAQWDQIYRGRMRERTKGRTKRPHTRAHEWRTEDEWKDTESTQIMIRMVGAHIMMNVNIMETHELVNGTFKESRCSSMMTQVLKWDFNYFVRITHWSKKWTWIFLGDPREIWMILFYGAAIAECPEKMSGNSMRSKRRVEIIPSWSQRQVPQFVKDSRRCKSGVGTTSCKVPMCGMPVWSWYQTARECTRTSFERENVWDSPLSYIRNTDM